MLGDDVLLEHEAETVLELLPLLVDLVVPQIVLRIEPLVAAADVQFAIGYIPGNEVANPLDLSDQCLKKQIRFAIMLILLTKFKASSSNSAFLSIACSFASFDWGPFTTTKDIFNNLILLLY